MGLNYKYYYWVFWYILNRDENIIDDIVKFYVDFILIYDS